MAPEQKKKPNRKKHSRRKGAGRKFLKWIVGGVVLFLIAGLVLAGIGFHIYQNRADYAARFLSREIGYPVEIGELEIAELGKFELKDVVVGAKEKDSPDLFQVDEFQITYNWSDLRKNGQIKSVHIKQPKLHLDEAFFDDMEFGEEDDKDPKRDFLSKITESIVVEDGAFHVDHPRFASVEGKFDHRAVSLKFGEDGLLEEPVESSFEDIKIGSEGLFGTIKQIDARWRVSKDFSQVKIENLRLDSPNLRIVPEWITSLTEPKSTPKPLTQQGTLPDPTGYGQPPNRVGSSTQQGTVDVEVEKLKLEHVDFTLQGFDGSREGTAVIPDVAFESDSVDWEKVSFKKGRLDSDGPVELGVRELVVGGGRANLVEAQNAKFKSTSLGAVVHDHHLQSAAGEDVKVVISDDSLSLWRDNPHLKKSPLEKKEGSFTVDEIDLPDADFTLTSMKNSMRALPEVKARVNAKVKSATFDSFGMHSDQVQQAELKDFTLRGPGVSEEEAALVKFPKANLSLNWNRFMSFNELENLAVDSPKVLITDQAMGEWVKPLDRSKLPVGPINRPVYRVKNIEVANGTMEANSTKFLDGRIPKVEGGFTIANDQIGQDLNDLGYRLKFNDLQIRNHPSNAANPTGNPDSLFPTALLPSSDNSEEVVKVKEALIDFTAKGIQRERTLKNVRLKGGVLRVGEGLKEIVTPQAEVDVTLPEAGTGDIELSDINLEAIGPGTSALKAPDLPVLPGLQPIVEEPLLVKLDPEVSTLDLPDLPPLDTVNDPGAPLPMLFAATSDPDKKPLWQIENLEIIDAKVNFDSLIPQMDGLSFGLDTKLSDIPLTAEGLLDANASQQVKLNGIEIRDPYDSFLTVAKFPDLFVSFNFAGISNQEIERIEVVSPTLNVGESLFRWVDYLRNYREINEGGRLAIGGKKKAESKEGEDGEEEAAQEEETKDWVIKRIKATAGKLVIAPYGTPIVSLPFPFDADTNIEEGRINLKMLIPEGKEVYELPDYGLKFRGLEGKIDFNLPVPETSNNLVQTFTLKNAQWNKLEMTDLFLSVTFDRYGIYGIFGGNAYGGYANGAFNYYLNKNGEWDAWVAGTNLNTGDLTQALVPEGFAMGGKVNLKLFTGGKNADISGVTGEVVTVGDGWFDIEVLDKALEKLPENWNSLQVGLSKIAVDTLKRFDYDVGKGEVFFKDDDGVLKLRFEGEYGSRNLNLHVHDWKTPIPAFSTTSPGRTTR